MSNKIVNITENAILSVTKKATKTVTDSATWMGIGNDVGNFTWNITSHDTLMGTHNVFKQVLEHVE